MSARKENETEQMVMATIAIVAFFAATIFDGALVIGMAVAILASLYLGYLMNERS